MPLVPGDRARRSRSASAIGLINAVVVVVMRDRLVHRDARDRLADPGADHDGHQRHADHRAPSSAGDVREDRPDRASAASRCRSSTARWSAVAIWYLLEHTATGRRLYATGFNPDAARLAGVRVDRLRFVSLVASGDAGRRHRDRPRVDRSAAARRRAGTPYLLPAFAAAFLGATQLKHGRFNAGGTIIAVLLLGTGVTGLALAAAPQWARRHVRRRRPDRRAGA